MYRIGLTGNIATGKTLVLRRLAEHGAFCVDADQVAHEVMERGQPAWADIREHFGESILDEHGEIRRAALAQVVFSDPEELQALERIVHPRVVERVESLLEGSNATVAVVEAIKLIESGLSERCHALWVTACSPKHQLKRLVRDRGLSPKEARARIQAQPHPGAKVCRADVLLVNEGTQAALLDLVDAEWRNIVDGQAPGQGAGPGRPYHSHGAWFVREGAYQAVAVPAGADRWRLLAPASTRMPRLLRPLIAALEAEAAHENKPPPGLLVPQRTGYCQFLQGMGYVEACRDGGEPGEALYCRRSR
ncbi:MAG: dephospho-CoA kinase [Anaerolineae bacterium]|nr:dephospho-CoA kinase [Anaerolineae bacterium]